MQHLYIYQYNDKISNSTVFFVMRVFLFKPFFVNVSVYLIKIWFILFICKWYHFVLFKVSYLHYVLIQGFTKLLDAVFTSLYIMIIFFIIKCPYCWLKFAQGICLPNFVADDFSKLILHPSILLIKDSRST